MLVHKLGGLLQRGAMPPDVRVVRLAQDPTQVNVCFQPVAEGLVRRRQVDSNAHRVGCQRLGVEKRPQRRFVLARASQVDPLLNQAVELRA
jgi:hypothetical protein